MYPTKQVILRRPVRHRQRTIALVQNWKRQYRGSLRSRMSLCILVSRLANLYDRPCTVRFIDNPGETGAYYDPSTATITLNGARLSVVTTLHEFAHHLFGRSEVRACRWSVWLFRRTFRRSYRRLDWRGHMLVRRGAAEGSTR